MSNFQLANIQKNKKCKFSQDLMTPYFKHTIQKKQKFDISQLELQVENYLNLRGVYQINDQNIKDYSLKNKTYRLLQQRKTGDFKFIDLDFNPILQKRKKLQNQSKERGSSVEIQG